jgi:hypothetical protein
MYSTTSTPSHEQDPAATPCVASTVNLLDSLAMFYNQEKEWVSRVRDVLREECFQDHDIREENQRVRVGLSIHDLIEGEPKIKQEDEDSNCTPATSPLASPRSRSHRRPKAHKVPLEEDALHILEMFEAMVESRAQSCQRITRLVRSANKRELYAIVGGGRFVAR